MRKKKELKAGTVIDIKAEHVSIILGGIDVENDQKFMMGILAEEMRKTHEQNWKVINSHYPQISDYICTVSPKKGTILVHYKKESVRKKEE